MSKLVITNKIVINAPAWRVWEVLTKPEYTRKFMFGCAAVSDWKQGSTLEWKGNISGKEGVVVKGRIIEIDSGKFLAYSTFDPNTGMEDADYNYLTVTERLEEQDGTTTLSITQGDFSIVQDGQRRYADGAKGWESVLPKIKELAEGKVN